MVPIIPCCKGSFQTGTKIVAIIDIVLAVLSLSLATFIIIMGSFPHLSEDSSDKDILFNEQVAVKMGVNILVLSFILLFLAYTLFEGASRQDPVRCIVWLFVKAIFLVMVTTSTVVNVIYEPKLEQSVAAVGIILTTCCLGVVFCFIQELKHQGDESFKPTHNYTVNEV